MPVNIVYLKETLYAAFVSIGHNSLMYYRGTAMQILANGFRYLTYKTPSSTSSKKKKLEKLSRLENIIPR